jgi:glycosyltransferase involved in cell wall biosynthesis
MTAIIVHRSNRRSDRILIDKYKVRVPVLSIDHGLYETDLFGKSRAQDPRNKSTILSFGHVRPDKGLDLLVRAYPGRDECAGLKLLIVGKAQRGYGAYFEEVVAGCKDAVWDQCYTPPEEIGKLYTDAAFAVLPYLECSQSGTLRLAMFLDTPVIASTAGDMPDFINRHEVGMVVPKGDMESLRRAMKTLANDPERRARYVRNMQALRSKPEMRWRVIVERLFEELRQRQLL